MHTTHIFRRESKRERKGCATQFRSIVPNRNLSTTYCTCTSRAQKMWENLGPTGLDILTKSSDKRWRHFITPDHGWLKILTCAQAISLLACAHPHRRTPHFDEFPFIANVNLTVQNHRKTVCSAPSFEHPLKNTPRICLPSKNPRPTRLRNVWTRRKP